MSQPCISVQSHHAQNLAAKLEHDCLQVLCHISNNHVGIYLIIKIPYKCPAYPFFLCNDF